MKLLKKTFCKYANLINFTPCPNLKEEETSLCEAICFSFCQTLLLIGIVGGTIIFTPLFIVIKIYDYFNDSDFFEPQVELVPEFIKQEDGTYNVEYHFVKFKKKGDYIEVKKDL